MIEIKELRAGYDLDPKQREAAWKPVVSVPEACFSEGQISCIIGKNGCGKSTLLKTLLGLLPYQGSIRLFGEELRHLKPKERAERVGYLPQTLTLPRMSVHTLAAHGCYRRKKMFQTLGEREREKIEAALAAADMREYRDKTVSELSGGERQRAFLAMLMAQDPAFFLLDEVTSYMDVEHQKRTTEIVRRLAASGKGVVMTTHDLALGFSLSDRILVMNGGSIVLSGTPEEVRKEKTLLRACFGVTVRRSASKEALYAYELQN